MSTNKFDKASGTFNLSWKFDADLTDDYLKSLINDPALKPETNLGEVKNYLVDTFFPKVSELLATATYGKHRLELDDESENTDILIVKDENTSAFGSRIWNSGHIELSIHHLHSPGLMLHELGHYLYNLGDEHGKCRMKDGNEIKLASIMAASFGHFTRYVRVDENTGEPIDQEYQVIGGFKEFWSDFKKGNYLSEVHRLVDGIVGFCKDGTHTSDKHTDHYKYHENKSCWAVMTSKSADVNRGGGEQFEYDMSLPVGVLND